MIKNQFTKVLGLFFTVCLLGACSFDASELELSDTQAVVVEDDFFADPVDPLDGFSRAMMEINFFLDDYILKPAATVYKALTPSFVQTGVGNFTEYVQLPFYMVNDLLQWRLDHLAQNFWVFTVNTFGGFGAINIAGNFDVYSKSNDFGMTLHTWGAGAGQDITLPILGATCLRDVAGSVVGFFADPFSIAASYSDYTISGYAVSGMGMVHSRAAYLGQLESLRRESYDPYATLKSIAKQRREAELRGLEND